MAKARTMSSRVQNNRPVTKATDDLQAPGLLAKWPIIGLLMVILGGLIFGALVYNLQSHGPLLQWDVPLSNTFHTLAVNSPQYIIEIMLFGFFLGKEFVVVIAVILILYFLHKRFWPEISMVLIGMGGGGLLWYFLSRFFDRPRPEGQVGWIVTDPSFPSGHTICSVLCYGFLAYLLVPLMPSRFWKWFVIVMAVIVIVFIGFSRLFTASHYLTDLIAGYAVGIAWAGIVYASIERTFKQGKFRNV